MKWNNIIASPVCHIYLIEKSLIHKITEKMDASKSRYLSKASIDSLNYNVITNSSSSQITPSFKTLEHVKYGIRSNDYMAFPIMNARNETTMVVEVRKGLEAEGDKGKFLDIRKDFSYDSHSNDPSKSTIKI